MKASLDGPRAKHRRAIEHIQALHGKIDEFAERNPDPKVEHFDQQTGRYTLAVQFGDEPDAERWGILLGDAIHNLRSALDHIPWQLVLLNGATPGPENQWPLCRSREGYLNQERRAVSASARPSCGVSRRTREQSSISCSLTALGRGWTSIFLSSLAPLSNADKHRIIQAGFMGIQGPPDKFLALNQDVGDILQGTFVCRGRWRRRHTSWTASSRSPARTRR